jgi:hypothetical protein
MKCNNKNKAMKKYLFYSILAALAILVVGTAFSLLAGLGAAGLTLATSVAGTVDTKLITDNSTEVLDSEYSQKITLMNPSRTPLDTIASMIKPVSVKSFDYKYYAVSNRPFSDTVATAYTGNKAYETAAINVTNIDMWAKHDTLKVNSSTGDDGYEVQLYVYDIDVENSNIKVQAQNCVGSGALASKQVVPSISKDTVLTRMAPAKNEKDAQTSAKITLPDQSVQYCQIFMMQIELGEYAEEYNKNIPFGWLDMARQQIYDFKATRELTYLFGVKAKITDKLDGKEKWLTGGVTRLVGQSLEYGTGGSDRTFTHDNLIDHSRAIFAGNSGSNFRVVFCGSKFLSYIMKLKQIQDTTADVTVDYLVKKVTGSETKVTYGVEFSQVKTNFGTLNYYYHPLFDEAGWDEKALVLDITHLEKVVFKPLRKREIDLKGSGQSLAKAEVVEECSGLVLRYPDCHAIIKPKA